MTNFPLLLYLRSKSDAGFAWLSAPGAAALSLLFLEGVGPVTPVPRRVRLLAPDGETLDEAMACDMPGGVLVALHGGPAVRRTVEATLLRQRFRQLEPLPFGSTRLQRMTFALLPKARGPAAVSMILEAARGTLESAELPEGANFLFNPPRVQLWGPVNAGKSSLLNALCGRHLAAVGDEPGLTRDVIEGVFEHEGFEIRLFDAPGTWAGTSTLDAEAQRLAQHWRAQADLVLTLCANPRVAELADKSFGYDVADRDSLTALKSALVGHFYGALRALPASRRVVLHPELRLDLESMPPSDVRSKWLV